MVAQLRFVSSRRVNLFLVLSAISLSVVLTSCTRKTSVQLATEKVSPGWRVQILEVSEPNEAMVLRQDPGVGVPIGVPAPPFEKDKKWLVVKINITPPPAQPKASPSPSNTGVPGGVQSLDSTQQSDGSEERPALKFADIQLISPNGEEYSAEAVATAGMWKGNKGNEIGEFLDPKNSDQVFKDASGRVLLGYQLGWLAFFRREPQEMVFLFAVPKRAPNLSLRL